MRTVSVEDFLPTLRLMVNGAMPVLMRDAVVRSAIRFCRTTEVIATDHTLSHVSEGQIFNVVSANELKASGECRVSQGETELKAGVDYQALAMDEIRFLREVNFVLVRCAVEPIAGAKTLPANLYEDWLQGICAGAASWLYTQPSILNGDLHAFYEREFVEQVRHAKRWRLETAPAVSRPTRKRSFF